MADVYRLRSVDVATVPMKTRIPFRYGIAVLTEMPHLFLRVTVEDVASGNLYHGVSADGLLPKWFEKDPDSSAAEDLQRMWTAIRQAADAALAMRDFSSPFRLWLELYRHQEEWGRSAGYPPLLWHFGVSLIERAVIDAVCRRWDLPFHTCLSQGRLGLDPLAVYPDVTAGAVETVVNRKPLAHIHIRHTVGLSDPLVSSEVTERVADGLPEAMEEDLSHYGLHYLKIKVNGDGKRDLARLSEISWILQKNRVEDYAFTLDGNEQFHSVNAFRSFWEELTSRRELSGFLRHLLFVEQPFSRKVALHEELGNQLTAWKDAPALIIDESDGALESVPEALRLGYSGTSHKNCKGVFKGLLNAIYIEDYNQRSRRHAFMSGEDLVNIGPVALLQDLAVMAALGIEHVERNGHHYIAGLSVFQASIQEAVLKYHNDLYAPVSGGFPALRITNGAVDLTSVNSAPFGVSFIPEAAYQSISDAAVPLPGGSAG